MNDTQNQLNNGSNSTDFQPSTQNPQSLNSNNLQTPATSVQPVQSGDGSTGQQLYQRAERQPNLTVQTDTYSANSLVSVAPTEPRSNTGLITVTSALVILLVLLMLTRRYWRPLSASKVTSPKNDAAAELQFDVPQATPAVLPQKNTPVKSKKRKSSAKKKKRSKR